MFVCVYICLYCTAFIIVGDIEKEFSQFWFLFEHRFVVVRMSSWIFVMIGIVVRELGSGAVRYTTAVAASLWGYAIIVC